MITPAYVVTMARYNQWQNSNLIRSANRVEPKNRSKDLGGFFGSIEQTCFHVVWGDSLWLSRFTDFPPPKQQAIGDSIRECESWAEYESRRVSIDAFICDWAADISAGTLRGDLTYYSGAAKLEICKSMGLLVTHFFNHQTHHRGQVHAMLTALGATTEDTDLPLLPENRT